MDIEKEGIEVNAIGERGFLIRGVDGEMYFRVYSTDGEFVDYEITNHDVEVVVIDRDAALIRNQAGNFLDYTSDSMNIVK